MSASVTDSRAMGDVATQLLFENEKVLAFLDINPVSKGHTLVIPRRPVLRFGELTAAERAALMDRALWVQAELARTLNPPPDAFNLGLNDGPAAGQTNPWPRRSSANGWRWCWMIYDGARAGRWCCAVMISF